MKKNERTKMELLTSENIELRAYLSSIVSILESELNRQENELKNKWNIVKAAMVVIGEGK